VTRSGRFGRLLQTGLAGIRSRTGRAMFLYALAFGVAGLTPFVLLPVLTQQLDPDEFGQATSWIVLAAMIANVGGLTTHGLVSVRYFKVDRDKLQRLMAAALFVVLAIHGALILYLWIGPDPFGGFTHLPEAYSVVAVATSLAISVNLIGLSLMQIAGRPGLYLLLRILQSAVEIGGCLLLLQLLAATPDVRILSYGAAVAASAVCGVAYVAARGLLQRAPDRRSVDDVLRFGVPMVPHVLAGQLLSNLDRLMVSYLLGVKELGIFMVASQLGMALSLVIEPLNRALAPWLLEHLAKDGEAQKERIVRGTYALFASLFVIALICAAAFIAVFDYIFTAEYSAAKLIVLPVALGMAFQGLYYGVVNYIFYAEATGRLSLVSSTTVALGIPASYLLVSNWGIAGAGISFMLVNAALFFSVWHLSRKVVKMPWFGPWPSTT
jgi:O-antigen/teichoic acid export membrane protein